MLVHFILDLETLSTKTNAVIASLGAISVYNGQIRDSFSVNIDIDLQIDKGMVIDSGSLRWWMEQSKEARMEIFNNPLGVGLALAQFNGFCQAEVKSANAKMYLKDYKDHVRLWGNGAHFDISKLANLYETFDYSKPWKPKADRCYRTVKNMYPDIDGPNLKDEASHIAVEDAHWQAKHLLKLQKEAGFTLQ